VEACHRWSLGGADPKGAQLVDTSGRRNAHRGTLNDRSALPHDVLPTTGSDIDYTQVLGDWHPTATANVNPASLAGRIWRLSISKIHSHSQTRLVKLDRLTVKRKEETNRCLGVPRQPLEP
jgi:hypothetical protein